MSGHVSGVGAKFQEAGEKSANRENASAARDESKDLRRSRWHGLSCLEVAEANATRLT